VGTAGELTVMGDTVNVASRLEQAAPIGSVLISHDTYRHIRGVFEVSVRDPIAVRGKSDPMQTYVVRGVKPRAFRIGARGVEGVETRTVGRDVELARLHAAYEHVAGGRGLRAALIVGEAGIGKSRLLYELVVWLELRSEQIRLVEGRARVGRQGTTLGLIRDMLARRFEIRDSDTAVEVDHKLRAGFGEALAPGDVDTVASWLGLGTTNRETTGAEHLAALGQAALVAWLRRVTDDMPTVILLEDLHWADRESLGVVWTIAEELSTNQLLVVGLSRPGTDLDGPWFDEYPFAERITLDPLDRTASVALVHEVLQRVDHVPDSVVDLIVDRSDGNPFFVEEIVKMLRDHGVIIDADATTDDGGWSIVPDRLDPSDVPTTISGVLQARLDQLDADGRTVLQHAAVMGRIFWDDAVAAMIARPLPSDAFATAVQRELVFPREHSSFDGSQEFVFKHALLREVAYETVLLRDRAALHARAAEWLTERAGDRVNEYLDTIADHHRRAAQHDEAARWLFRAAAAAFERGLVPVTLDKLREAIVEWEHAGTPAPIEALLLFGETQRRHGNPDGAERTLRAVLDRIGPDDAEPRAEALYLLAEVAFDRASEADEIALLQEAEQLVSGDRSLVRCRIAVGLAWWETRYGDLGKAEQHGRDALALADELHSDRMRWRTHGVLGPIAAMRDALDEAERHAIASVEIAKRLGDMGGEALSIGNLGVVTHLLGDATASVRHYRDALAYYERDVEFRAVIGDRLGAIRSIFNRAQVLVRLGECDRAAAAIRDGLTRSFDSMLVRHLLLGVEIEADRLLAIGRIDDGLDLLAVVRDHPATQRGDWKEIDRILGRVSLAADALDGRIAPGAPSDIESVARAILDR
ncbi:MAG: AAA family ATPase, partial [Ilumatobacteraceae bacterium]